MNRLRLAGQKLYTSQEARTLLTMLTGETTRDLAINLLLTSKKRLPEEYRRALHRELNLIKTSLRSYTYQYANGQTITWGYNPMFDKADPERDAALRELLSIEWRHSKKTYTTEEWQKNNRKMEYRRSAKNHYS